MLCTVRHHLTGLANQATLLPARARARWQAGVALVSMLTLVVMLFAAVSHQHASGALDEDDCIVCNLAFDTLDDIPAAPLVAEPSAPANFYYLLVSTPPSMVDLFHPVSPPSCGPPPLSA